MYSDVIKHIDQLLQVWMVLNRQRANTWQWWQLSTQPNHDRHWVTVSFAKAKYFGLRPNLPLRPKSETEVWSQNELNLSNPVSNQTTWP